MRAIGLLAATAALAHAAIPDQDWGYVDIREGAHSFWWLYGSTAATPRENTPLVMWLQGGPGASSTGFGNFNEIGPTALLANGSLAPRDSSWLQLANLLFLDNPVGTGWSYVDDPKYLTTNNTQIADDIVTLLAAFVGKYPALSSAPFYVFCESYGGKMTTGLASALIAAIGAGSLKMDFRGIALGDSWVSPVDYVDTWVPYLRASSIMDARDATEVAPTVQACNAAVASGQWAEATNQWGNLEGAIGGVTDGVNWYNINFEIPVIGAAKAAAASVPALSPFARSALPAGADASIIARAFHRTVATPYGQRLGDPLADLMNGAIRSQLNAGPGGKVIPDSVTWGGQSNAVFSALSPDFMKPVWEVVSDVLTTGRINVTVYNGQLDLICCTPGTEAWMARMDWPGMKDFYGSTKVPVALPGTGGSIPGAFKKTAGNGLTMWYVLQAGHMVPADQPAMALAMVADIIGVPSPVT